MSQIFKFKTVNLVKVFIWYFHYANTFHSLQLYQEDQSATSWLRIAGYINDTGEYICEADYQGLKVKSNPINLDIHGKSNALYREKKNKNFLQQQLLKTRPSLHFEMNSLSIHNDKTDLVIG